MISLMVSPLTAVLAVAAIVMSVVALLLGRKSSENIYKNLPGPRGLPLIGCSHIIGRYKKHWDAFSALRREYGDIYGMTVGTRRCVVISSMSYIKEVLVTKSADFANRPDFLRFHAIFRGDRNLSIALCDWSEKHNTRRKLAFPFMHPRAQTFDSGRMNDIIIYELQQLSVELSKVSGEVIDPRSYLLFTTANIFYQYLCSKRFGSDDTNFLKIVKIYDIVFRELFQGFAIDFMPWLKVFNGQRLQELKELAENVSNITSPLFEEHEKDIDHNKSRDLIDIFLSYLKDNDDSSSSALTREDAEVIVEDLIGGHSVLGNLWLWGLYILAAHPEVQENIREEVERTTYNQRVPTISDKPDMPYTEATTYELLRCIASPIIPHVATKNTTIKDYKVSKGSMVMFNTYDMNMDPQLWDKPRSFNPQRFISSEGKVTKPEYFIPFGTGKRTCLGDGLVKSTLFLGLSTLLQHFRLSLPEGMPRPDLYEIPGLVVPNHQILLVCTALNRDLDTEITSINMS